MPWKVYSSIGLVEAMGLETQFDPYGPDNKSVSYQTLGQALDKMEQQGWTLKFADGTKHYFHKK